MRLCITNIIKFIIILNDIFHMIKTNDDLPIERIDNFSTKI